MHFDKNTSYNPRKALQFLNNDEKQKYLDLDSLEQCLDKISLNPKMAWFYYREIAKLYIQSGYIDASISYLQASICLKPRSDLSYYYLGKAFACKDKLKLAFYNYKKASRLNCNFYKYDLECGKVMLERGDFQKAYVFLKQAIKKQPNLSITHLYFSQVLAKIGTWYDALIEYRQAIFINPLLKNSRKINGEIINLNACYDIWIFLNQNREKQKLFKNSTELPCQKDIKISVLQKFIFKIDYRLETVYLYKTSKQQIYRNKKNIKIQHLKDFIEQFNENEHFDYFAEAVQKKALPAIDPLTGNQIYSNQFVFFLRSSGNHIAYRFDRGSEVFYLFLNLGRINFFYIPSMKIALVSSTNARFGPAKLIPSLKFEMISLWEDFVNYFTNSDQKELSAICGSTRPAHYFRRHLQEFQHFKESGLLGKIPNFLLSEPGNFLKTDLIFPELQGKLKSIQKEEEITKYAINNNYLLLYFYSRNGEALRKTFSSSLKTRIQSAAALQAQNSEYVQLICPKIENCSLLIWVGISTLERRWIDQVEGLSAIIKKLSDSYSNIGVLVDGWTCPENSFSETDRKHIQADENVYNELVNAVPEDIQLFSLIGRKSYEKIYLAQYIDFFITAGGTQSIYVSFIVDKPGVIHHNNFGLKKTPTACGQNAFIVDSKYMIEVPNRQGKQIIAAKRDYYCDWKGIYELIEQIWLSNGNFYNKAAH
mgnify:CR=1 FL=1